LRFSSAPESPVPSDLIAPGTTRAYSVDYRDPIVLGGCSSASRFDATHAVPAIWIP